MKKAKIGLAPLEYRRILTALLAALESSNRDNIVYVPAGSGFNAGMMDADDEKAFRAALKRTKVCIISIPLGRKRRRFKDLFEDGKVISEIKRSEPTKRNILFIPTKIFSRVWCSGGTPPPYAVIVR